MRWLALAALLAGGATPDGDATRALDDLRRGFAIRSRKDTERELEALAARYEGAPATASALLWLGDLELGDGAPDRAERRFAEVARRFPSGESAALAERGLGSCAFARHDWGAAAGHFGAALARARDPALAAELQNRRDLALRERTRYRIEFAAWALCAAAALRFLVLARRGMRLPLATWFLIPVYALLVAGAWGRDAAVTRALALVGGGSLLLTTLALAPTAPRSRRALALDAALVALATSGLAYAALRRSGALDALWQTLQIGVGPS